MLAHRQAFRPACTRSVARSRLTIVCKDSRIGRAPVVIPKGVTVTLEGNFLRVKVWEAIQPSQRWERSCRLNRRQEC